MNKTRRLFVGIPLSSVFRKRLIQEMEKWPKEALLCTTEGNLHVMLFSLGFVQEETIGEICCTVGEVCQKREAFELVFTKMSLLDSDESPKMIRLEGDENDELRILVEDIEKKFGAFIQQRKSYRPHITLAKIKKSKWLALPTKPILKEKMLLMETVESVAVFESLSIDGKRCYETIDTFLLI